MPREKSNSVFKLVKSLSKNEKRYFKIYAKRGGQEDLKFIQLFDALSEQEEFNDEEIIRLHPEITATQLSNLKAELYHHLMESLRLYQNGKVVEMTIRQNLDFAQILTDRCLYSEALKQLKKAKKLASKHEHLELLLEAARMEKDISSQLIDNDNQKKVNNRVSEVSKLTDKINRVYQISNLESKLNSLYKKVGFIRDQRDHNAIEAYLNKNLPKMDKSELSNLEKIHLHNLQIGYYFFIHDFEQAYQESTELYQLFRRNPSLIKSKTNFYIQSLNKLSIAQSKLGKYNEYLKTIQEIQEIPSISGVLLSRDLRTRIYKYYYMHELNRYMMLGEFELGVSMIEDGMDEFVEELDQHSTIIFYYRIACMYFGNSDYNQSIKWLNRIISMQQVDIRRDIHCFARILNLVAHYEIGNLDVIDYYIRSTYRFLAKKYDLRMYQKYILRFLKDLGNRKSREELQEAFHNLKEQLLTLRDKPYEKRAFIYFDIISWLESKIQNRQVSEVIKEKAKQRILKQEPLRLDEGE